MSMQDLEPDPTTRQRRSGVADRADAVSGPSFELGNADTTGRVLVKQLICACPGLPRHDQEMRHGRKSRTRPSLPQADPLQDRAPQDCV
jgi:hypothetical protein